MARVWRLLVLIAVLLMPLGMTPGAAATAHHPTAAGMAMDHCPDQDSHHQGKGGIAECAMACAGAVPAADLVRRPPPLIVCEPIQPVASHRLVGRHPEIATPPPKRS